MLRVGCGRRSSLLKVNGLKPAALLDFTEIAVTDAAFTNNVQCLNTSHRWLFDAAGNLQTAPNNLVKNGSINGSLPATWLATVIGGVTPTITFGAYQGRNGFFITYAGTPNNSGGDIYPAGNKEVPGQPGNSWISSVYLALVGGDLTNAGFSIRMYDLNAAGGFISTFCNSLTPQTVSSSLQRYYVNGTSPLADTTTAFVRPVLHFSLTNGQPINLTLFIADVQVELVTAAQTTPRAFMPTSGAAYYGPAFDYGPASQVPSGTELLTANWLPNAAGTTVDYNNGVLKVTSVTAPYAYGYQSVSTTVGATYQLKSTFVSASGSGSAVLSVRVGSSQGGTQNVSYGTIGTSYTFVATAPTTYISFGGNTPTLGAQWTLTGMSLQQMVPATAALRIEEARTNIFLNSGAPATQSVAVTAQAYTLSLYGTGSITLSGAYTGTLAGPGAWPSNSATLTFTPTAGTLTLTVSGSIQYPQLEAGVFASSYISTGASAVLRTTDVLQLTGGAKLAAASARGSVVLEAREYASSPWNSPYFFDFNDGGFTNRVYSWSPSATTVKLDPAGLTSPAGGDITATARRVGYAWGSGAQAISYDGGAVTSGATPWPSGMTTFAMFGSNIGGNPFAGYILRLAIYNARLPDATLKAKTVLGAPL